MTAARSSGCRRSPRPPAPRWRTPQLRRNLAHATATIRAKRRGRRRGRRLGGAAAGRRGDQGPRAARPRPLPGPARGVADRGRGASCTGPATPPRPAGSSPTSRVSHGADEVVKVKSMATQEIGLNEALAARGHRGLGDRPGRADRAARRRPAAPHPGAGDPPQPRRDPRDLPARDGQRRAGRRRDDLTDEPAGARRGGAAAPAGEVPARQGGGLRRQLRRRRDRHAGRGRVRGQRADVPDPARRARHRRRHREAPADLGGPRRLPAAAARVRRPASG